MQTNTQSAPIYYTETISATHAQVKDQNGKVVATVTRPITLAKIREAIATAQTVNPFKVGDGVTLTGYSDSYPFTVIRIVSARCMIIQEDNATLLNGTGSDAPDKLQFSPGGFFGHTSGKQRYTYAPNPKGHIETVRLTKRGWKATGKHGKRMSAGRSKYYDYNF